jgi:hypothetical protein
MRRKRQRGRDCRAGDKRAASAFGAGLLLLVATGSVWHSGAAEDPRAVLPLEAGHGVALGSLAGHVVQLFYLRPCFSGAGFAWGVGGPAAVCESRRRLPEAAA